MRKSMHRWFLVLLAVSLLMPIYSMADMKLQIVTREGEIITSKDSVVKGFFVDSSNNLNVLIDGSLLFDGINPPITISNCNGCTLSNPWDGTVTAQVPPAGQTKPISFNVATVTNGTISAVVGLLPTDGGSHVSAFAVGATPNVGTFTWTIDSDDPGTYLPVFHATHDTNSSDMWVTLKLTPPETVTPPTAISPTTATLNRSAAFTASGSTSSMQHALEYQFDWSGNGTDLSAWSSSAQSHTFGAIQSYPVKVRARCVPDQTTSEWATFSVNVTDVPSYLLTVTAGTGGTISSCSPASGGSYTAGTSVTIQATADGTHTFSGWSGTMSSASNPYTFTMPSSPVTLTANFTSNGSGNGTHDNPIPLNVPMGLGYGPDTVTRIISQGQTVWFKADPYVYGNYATGALLTLTLKYNDQVHFVLYQDVRFSIYSVNRETGAEAPFLYADADLANFGERGDANISLWTKSSNYNTNTYYLIAVRETGVTSTPSMNFYWR